MCILGRNVLSQWQLFLWVYMLNINCIVLLNRTVESETSSNLLPYFLFRKKITDSLTSIIHLWLFWSLSCKFSQIWGNLIGTVSKGIGFFVLEKNPKHICELLLDGILLYLLILAVPWLLMTRCQADTWDVGCSNVCI